MANKQHKYNADLYDTLVWSMAIKGFTNEEIAKALGISERTLLNWRTKYKSFGTKFTEGRKIATAQVEEALFKKATGYIATEIERTIKYDDEGNEIPIGIKQRTKHIVPDTTAIIFWLKNRDSANWKDNIEIENTGGDGLAQSLLTQVRMLNIDALEQKEKLDKEAKKKIESQNLKDL